MNQSCHGEEKPGATHQPSCHKEKGRLDILFWGSLLVVSFLYVHVLIGLWIVQEYYWYQTLAVSVYELVNTMWIGVALGVLMVALLAKIPREFVISILGTNRGLNGVLRATAAGVLLDLCSHGILMVGAKLYERGASIGQVMAFLVASPWNSFSLTLVLIALIGFPWTLGFIVLSMFIAIATGLIFDTLVRRGTLPENPYESELPTDFHFWREVKSGLKAVEFTIRD